MNPRRAEQGARVAYAVARVHYFAMRYDASLEAIARARALAADDPVLLARCDTSEADVAFYQDRFGDAERIAGRAESLASLDDPDLAGIGASAAHRLAEIAVVRGDAVEAEACGGGRSRSASRPAQRGGSTSLA